MTPRTPHPALRTISIIQARMGSSRLPGKVLLPIAGKPMLQWVVERAKMARTLTDVVIATTTDPNDDPIAEFCAARGWSVTRGSAYDVLDRYMQAAREHRADIIVRITADCPLIDGALIDKTVNSIFETRNSRLVNQSPVSSLQSLALDFAANRLPPPWGRSTPIGLDVEVCTFAALTRAHREATAKHHREHVMPYFYDDLPNDAFAPRTSHIAHISYSVLRSATDRDFSAALLHHTPDRSDVRWTVDTPQDLKAMRALMPLLPKDFSWLDALAIWDAHPEISAINAGVRHKTEKDTDHRI